MTAATISFASLLLCSAGLLVLIGFALGWQRGWNAAKGVWNR